MTQSTERRWNLEDGPLALPNPVDLVRDPMGILRRRWRWALAGLLLGLAAVAVYAATWEPRYRATTTVLVASQAIPKEFVKPSVVEDPMERINAMVAAMLSGNRLRDMVEKYGLYPEILVSGTPSAVIGNMRADIHFEEGRRQSRSQTAAVYSISYTHGDPEMAATIANELASVFIETSVASRTQQARVATEFVTRELERVQAELEALNHQIRVYKETHRGELPSELGANMAKLERLQLQRQSLAMQLAQAESQLTTLAAVPEPDSPEARLAQLRQELANELSVHTEEHPNVGALRRQIILTEQELRTNGSTSASRRALANAAGVSMAAIRRQMIETEAQVVDLDRRVAATPKHQVELDEMEQRAQVLRENYHEFLNKVHEAELAQSLESAQQGERVSVLDPARPPYEPVRPLWKMMAAGITASFGLALGLAMALEMVDPVALTRTQIERVTGLPVLGTAPRF